MVYSNFDLMMRVPIEIVESVSSNYQINKIAEVTVEQQLADFNFISLITNTLKESISVIDKARQQARASFPELFN